MILNEIKLPENISTCMWKWAVDLFPITRSITGQGVRQTLNYLKDFDENLEIKSINSGTKVFDWTVPDEWIIRDAYVMDESGEKIIDFSLNNLHLLGYSIPINKWVDYIELNKHLYSLPSLPNAIPYVTSYYSRDWGFCVTQLIRDSLKKDGRYHVVVDSEIKPGVLNYGELNIKSTIKSKKEILISTYICHPSMANNEISGPVVSFALAQCIKNLKKRKYNYRFVFIPETIGSLVYLSRHLKELKNNVIAGFNVTCIGDNREYSYLPSRDGNTLSDKIAKHILKWTDKNYKSYSWLDRGSDERQYCAPGIDLPIATIMRTKYGEYPEYHTSLDNLGKVVTQDGLLGGLKAISRAIEAIENNIIPNVTTLGEPQLGKRDLYHRVSKEMPNLVTVDSERKFKLINDIVGCADGQSSLLELAEYFGCPIWELYSVTNLLIKEDLIRF